MVVAPAAHLPPLAQATLCRHPPEVGAVCGKAARTVLCGGRAVMRVPTAPASLAMTGWDHDPILSETALASGPSNREVKSNFAHLAVLHAAGQRITLAPPNSRLSSRCSWTRICGRRRS